MRYGKSIRLGALGAAGAAMLTLAATGQDRPRPEPGQRPPQEVVRGEGAEGEVRIVLRPLGEGRFEVFVNGERVEARAVERIRRALQDPRLEGRRPGLEEGEAGERPVRPGRSPQGEGPPLDRALARPGAEGEGMEGMPPMRSPIGQAYAGPVPELTDELLAEVMGVIADLDEPLHTRLSSAMERNPDVVRNRLQADLPRWMTAVELKRNDPELYELNVKDRRLAQETGRLVGEFHAARRAGDAEKVDGLRARIETLAADHFDVRQKLRERDLAQLQQRLEFLRAQVQQRRERRQEVIRQHLQQLFGGPADEF